MFYDHAQLNSLFFVHMGGWQKLNGAEEAEAGRHKEIDVASDITDRDGDILLWKHAQRKLTSCRTPYSLPLSSEQTSKDSISSSLTGV